MKNKYSILLILTCIFILPLSINGDELYVDFKEDTNLNHELVLDILDSKILSANWSPVYYNNRFYFGISDQSGIILPIIEKKKISQYLNIDPNIEILKNITNVTLTLNKPKDNKSYCKLLFNEKAQIKYNREDIEAIVQFENDQGIIKIVDIHLKNFIQVTNYKGYAEILDNVKLKVLYHDPTKLPTNHSLRGDSFCIDKKDINQENEYSLITDLYNLPIDSQQILHGQIEIPKRKLTVNIQDISNIQSFSIVAFDKNNNNRITLASLDDVDNNSIKIPKLNYVDLNYIYKLKNVSKENRQPIESSSDIINIKQKDYRYVKIPGKYSGENFTIQYWNNQDNTMIEVPYLAYDDSISIYNALKNTRVIRFVDPETSSIKKITLNEEVQPPMLNIHEKTPLIIIDLNHTHKIDFKNKKNKEDFKKFVNDVLELTYNQNFFVNKFFTLAPSNTNVFMSYGIDKIRIRKNSPFTSFSSSEISNNNFGAFMNYLDNNNINIIQNEIFDNFFVLEPFVKNRIISLKTTNANEDINSRYYRENVIDICNNYFDKYQYSVIIYITYYPLDLSVNKDDSKIDFYSYKKDKDIIIKKINTLRNREINHD
ncbi:MAG: hypothetical protein H8D22_00550 [Candidatus Cloacimonetes bacterium]|nr:hypothetical protein [Candidatus Cloacimonadota bacterium]